MSRHRSPGKLKRGALLEAALEQNCSRPRGAHRLLSSTATVGSRIALAAVAASALSASGPALASADTPDQTVPAAFGGGTLAAAPAFAEGGAVDRAVSLAETAPAPQPTMLQSDSSGAGVQELQRVLNAWYPSMTPLAEDGVFGSETESRVRTLQERAEIAVDGIAGPETLGVLHMSTSNLPTGEAAPAPAVGGSSEEEAEAEAEADEEEAEAPVEAPAAPAVIQSEGGVVMPAEGEFTSGFGSRWGSSHNGIDIANDIGTPIYSTMAGEVVESGPASGFGMWVRVQHPDGTMSVYGHINESLVSAGQQVAAGEQIATIGNRGQSTGPHLHFEIWENGENKIDPAAWLEERGVSM